MEYTHNRTDGIVYPEKDARNREKEKDKEKNRKGEREKGPGVEEEERKGGKKKRRKLESKVERASDGIYISPR